MSTAGHIFGYQVSDRPGVWLRVIAPADDLQSLRTALEAKFRGRLLAVRNEADRAAVILISGDASCTGAAPAPVRVAARPRHRWERVEVHRYRCIRCQMERRNWLDQDTFSWFTTFAAPGQPPRRCQQTPPCAAGVRHDAE